MSSPSPSLRLGHCPARIVGSGVAFPPRARTTEALLGELAPALSGERREALLAHLLSEIGVLARAHLEPGAEPLELAVRAARAALAEAGATPAALLCATSTATRWTTAESALLARALGLDVAFVDLKSGCTGGLWALVEGARLVRDAGAPVLVVGVDSFSRAFPAGERLLPFAMGDGAAALVLAPAASDEGLVRAVFGGEPGLVDLATVKARLPPAANEPFALGGDPDTFARAAEAALTAAVRALACPPESLLVPHVGRLATARRLAAEHGLACFTDGFVQHGNLGAASLLTALHLLRDGAPRATLLALASAGGGLSYGAALWRLAGGRA